MTALPPDDHRKLVAILSRLGSDAPGERATAALKATELLSRIGATWADIIPAPVVAVVPFDGMHLRRQRVEKPHQRLARVLLQTGHPWDDWQRGFLRNMVNVDKASSRQSTKLEEMRSDTFGGGGVRHD